MTAAYIHPATNEQVTGWTEATLAPLPEPRWSDFVVSQLCARIADDQDRIRRLIGERNSAQITADQKAFVRRELEAELGTEDVAEAVRLIRQWKAGAK
jgi:hypothetical protein